MSDGIRRMYEEENERKFIAGVEKIKAKDAEEIYVLLKDLHMDLQTLQCDERLIMTRGQFACLNRAYNVVKDLLK